MSQLLGRVAKLSSAVKKQRLCFSELRSFSTAATPYLLLRDTNHRMARTPSGGGVVLDMNLYDPRKDEKVKVPDQTLSEELRCSVKVGTSRGWVFLRNKQDSTMRLTNIYNPCASASSHKVINLPPFDDTEAHIASISLSASPNQQDCVVAAKSCFSFISLCRPGDSDWTHIKVPFYAPQVMYSLRDSKFYLYWWGKQYSDDLIECETSSSGFPEVSLYQSFPNSDIPESRRDQVSSYAKTQYLVESPNSGDSFIVYWCNEYLELKEGEPESCNGKKTPYRRRTSSFMIKPRTFVVFRQDREQGIGSYTEDIGDLCIFLGQSEAFCVSATECPGLHPNSVYYSSFRTGYGYYDLSSNTLHEVIDEAPLSAVSMWLAPLQ